MILNVCGKLFICQKSVNNNIFKIVTREMDDDFEFREVITKELENIGVLQEIRAKIRANIFDIVKDDLNSISSNTKVNSTNLDESDRNNSNSNDKSKQIEHLNIPKTDTIIYYLIKEYLQSKNLNYTENVFSAETNMRSKSLDLDKCKGFLKKYSVPNEGQPILEKLIENVLGEISQDNSDMEEDIAEEDVVDEEATEDSSQLKESISILSDKSDY